MKILILADDLTGACDAAVKLQQKGYQTEVITTFCQKVFSELQGGEIISVNTDTRDLPAAEAAAVVNDIMEKISWLEDCLIYKKIDSVLRGNIVSEIDAIISAGRAGYAIISSSLPSIGRSVANGVLKISSDCCAPSFKVSQALGLCEGQYRIIPLDLVRNGAEAVFRFVSSNKGLHYFLADSETDEDLKIIAHAGQKLGSECLLAGSAGLAAQLLPEGSEVVSQHQIHCEGIPLIVAGTRHPLTVQQVQRLKSEGLKTYVIHCDDLTGIPDIINENCGKGILITTDRIYNNFSERQWLRKNGHNAEILRVITDWTEKVFRENHISAIIATGGDVSSSVLSALGFHVIHLRGEFVPGVVLGESTNAEGQNILVSTKSGGFGSADTLAGLYRYAERLEKKQEKPGNQEFR